MLASNFFRHIIICLTLIFSTVMRGSGQAGACFFKDTLLSIDFGTNTNKTVFELGSFANYKQAFSSCPDDGFYSLVSNTSNCFNGDWITLSEDHTSNDNDGRFMLVNASENSSDFFYKGISGFKPGSTYEFDVWLLNVCKINSGCAPLPPNILIKIFTSSGQKIADFKTGLLPQTAIPAWKKYTGLFTIPAGGETLRLVMQNMTNGSCGNDFAMDDIIFRECYPPPPPARVSPVTLKKTATINPPVKTTEDIKTPATQIKPLTKNDVVANKPSPTGISTPSEIIIPQKENIPLPLISRKNPVVKKIETSDGEVLIQLYDNGEIDGDTVTIYHNNELVVAHQGLSEKPITIKIKVDPANPYHELIMVADNLGTIPPNTSLMIVTANGKRYEVFISSSKQENAKIIIRKKE